MSLLTLDKFEQIFAPLDNQQLGFIKCNGGIDNQLNNTAVEQLLSDFHLPYREIMPHEIKRGEFFQPVDAIVVSGGIELSPESREHIHSALTFGVPVHVLPLTLTDKNEDISPFERVFVREKYSLQRVPGTLLAPELSLALRRPWVDEGVEAGTGVWLRNDSERVIEDPDLSLGDPADISWSPCDYFGLASKFEHIVTDRLHFAIAGLLVNRRVTLLPDASGNNRAVYESWLKELGCRWRNGLSGIESQRQSITDNLWKRLSSPPSGLIGWHTRPCRDEECKLIQTEDSVILRKPDETEIHLNPTAMVVWSLCDGEGTVEDICSALAEHYHAPVLDIARDVQTALQNFKRNEVLKAQQPKLFANDVSAPSSKTRNVIDVDITAPRKKKGRILWSAHVRGTSLGDFIHYFEFDSRWRSALTKRGDPFVLALLPRAMEDGADLRISGAPIDAQLLDHLDEYQQAWHSWRPAKVTPIGIQADEIVVSSQYAKPSVTAFSGGLDSTHTICRHTIYPDQRRKHKLGAALMACGFDIPINDRDGFKDALNRLHPVTNDAGLDLIDVYTNVRTHIPSWVMGHGAALASVLCLFSGRFGSGLIPSTFSYQELAEWGSNPISDHLLGGSFKIEHDSAALSRYDKFRAIAHWPAGLQQLRVCWRNRDSANNCGHCNKCYQLAIFLQSRGLALECFDKAPKPSQLADYTEGLSLSGFDISDYWCILENAQKAGIIEHWVNVLDKRLADISSHKSL